MTYATELRGLLGTMEHFQRAQELGLGNQTTVAQVLEGTRKRIQRLIDTTCPDCFGRGWVYRAGSGEPDDPPDEVECDLCQGTGETDPRWARANKVMMYCQDCGKWLEVAQFPYEPYDLLCVHCWHEAIREMATAEKVGAHIEEHAP